MEVPGKYKYLKIGNKLLSIYKGKIFHIKPFIIFYIFLILKLFENKYNSKKKILSKDYNEMPLNKYYIFNIFKNIENNNEYFNLTFIKNTFSFRFKILKVEYNIAFYDDNNNLISPSDLILYKNIHIICYFQLEKSNTIISSLANIYQNKYFNCVEFFVINEKIKFGLKIIQKNENIEYSDIYCFNEAIFKYNNLINENNNIFDPLFINNEYKLFINKINNKHINETLKLKQSYIQYPYCILKRNYFNNENKWNFINLYNNYYCFCKGQDCLKVNVTHQCKFSFYSHIIDNNRNVYKKTDYLFIDFIFAELTSDDTFPIFKEMIKEKSNVHYITEKKELYKEYCNETKKCLAILLVNKENNPINGDFLEKYLTLFLKLKVVVSARGTTFNTNIFYNIEYITYICITHGVCFFKYYLYNDYRIYGRKKNDKLLITSSDIIISVAKRYGWDDKDLIKMNLPKWDKYNNDDNDLSLEYNKKLTNNSIFIMFTWRDITKYHQISSYYLHNITQLINNINLNKILVKKKIKLYIAFHRLIDQKYINNYKLICTKKKYMQFIEQNEISECISKTSLVVSDFSSVIFDLMYRRKPYIIYIPDVNDPNIKDIYTKDYYELIESIKNDTIYFENKYFNINEAVNKIIYYINNNFNLDEKLEKLYDNFGFKKENYTDNFIYYLKNIL